MKLINKTIFVWFHIGKKAFNFINNHFTLRDIVIKALAVRKNKVVSFTKYIIEIAKTFRLEFDF